jgi:hypothetical protein
VTAARIRGSDALVDGLVHPAIDRIRYPLTHYHDGAEDAIRNAVTDELAAHIEPEANGWLPTRTTPA